MIWCSCRTRWAHVLLRYHLGRIVLKNWNNFSFFSNLNKFLFFTSLLRTSKILSENQISRTTEISQLLFAQHATDLVISHILSYFWYFFYEYISFLPPVVLLTDLCHPLFMVLYRWDLQAQCQIMCVSGLGKQRRGYSSGEGWSTEEGLMCLKQIPSGGSHWDYFWWELEHWSISGIEHSLPKSSEPATN